MKHPSLTQNVPWRRAACWLMTGLAALLLARCDTTTPDDQPPMELIAPPVVRAGEVFPVVVRSAADAGADAYVSGRFTLQAAGATLGVVSVKKGMGSLSSAVAAAGEATLTLEGATGSRRLTVLDSIPAHAYAGTLTAEEAAWDASADRLITADLVVPEGVTLTVAEGTRVLLGPRVNLLVRGSLDVRGTAAQPVLFTAAEADAPWGGLEVHQSTATLTYAFFTRGGDDDSRLFGHSNSQPVVKAEEASVTMQACYVVDNPGKGLAGWYGELTFSDGLISRCDTGGEFSFSRVHVLRSHVLDIPNDDGVFIDDDNDGLYFWNVHPSGLPSKVENTFIITGKDDAIDHNEALLEVNHAWLEGFLHEGVAGSNANRVRVYDTVIRGCEQGIEAGYGHPNVEVDHSVVTGNDVGLRFGDSYTSGSTGRMTVTNTIVVANDDNVRNFDLKAQAPVDSGIVVSYSLFDVPEDSLCATCLTATPRFDDAYHLLPGSPGEGAASDGTDLGLVAAPETALRP